MSVLVRALKQPSSVAFSPDGGKLAVGYDDSATVEVLSGTNLDLLYRPDIQGAERTDMRLEILTFGPGGHLFGGGSYDKKVDGAWWRLIRRWDRDGAGTYLDFKGAENAIADIKPLADGSVLVAGSQPDFGRYTANGKKDFLQTRGYIRF
jgi:WD40 repeat protein